MHCTISYNILYKVNSNFLIAKVKAILPLIKPISEEKSLYIDVFNKKDLGSINYKNSK